ncbi:Arc family DNA-binding protein [Gemella palaticanis]|uniref:Arc family DNA-binding protein n=1 Tax=Gemelliphila palaticanis TaxID=81950 RepID=A0ABX2SYH8_9BACL|nr:Arc family DNA-binding protein [Gemella palaticanis]NYS47062.1 Arc family DNA-binding protein [Gemella palaticanis]
MEDKEKELIKKQKELKDKEKAKKQVLLRLAPSLWEDLARWAEEDLRSINSQIEFLLREAVKQKFKK